jgi:hypothetical protein
MELIKIGLVIVGFQEFKLSRMIFHLLMLVGELGSQVRCEGGGGVTGQKGTMTSTRTSRGSSDVLFPRRGSCLERLRMTSGSMMMRQSNL